MTHIFVDESGDIGLSNNSNRFFVYGFIYCVDPSTLRYRLREQLRVLHKYDLYPRVLDELKFNLPRVKLLSYGYTRYDIQRYENSMFDIRLQICNLISRPSDGIFAAVVDKTSIVSKSWTPTRLGNYVFANTLHTDILNELSLPNGITLVYDDGRLDIKNSYKFHAYLWDKDSYFRNMGKRVSESFLVDTKNVLSTTEPGIWAADILAGAFYHHHAFNQDVYRKSLIANCKLIQHGFRIYWK